MKTSTGIIDYYLKERIEGQNSKITLSGSYLRFEIRDHIHFNAWWEIWSGLTLEKIKK